MARQTKQPKPQQKEIRAWGIRRREVDINQLALAYYLLARTRIEQQRAADAASARESDATNQGPGNEQSSEAA